MSCRSKLFQGQRAGDKIRVQKSNDDSRSETTAVTEWTGRERKAERR